MIPFKDEAERTIQVGGWVLLEEGVDLILCDNGSSHEESDRVIEALNSPRMSIHWCSAMSIYQMWNFAWRTAKRQANGEPFNMAFLNNDIWYCPDSLTLLAKALRSKEDAWIVHPNWHRDLASGIDPSLRLEQTHGTFAQNGLSGSMFMLRGELLDDPLPPVDEQFEWWCGDDDLVRQVALLGGKQYRVTGIPLFHENEATASNGKNEWTHAAKGRDLERLERKYS